MLSLESILSGRQERTSNQTGVGMKSRNVFVSHMQEDEAYIQKLYDLLGRSGFQCKDSSITSQTPNNAQSEDYIKYQVISPQIEWAGVVVVLITPDTRTSDWVNWEVERASALGKRIVGIWVHGEGGCDLPESLVRYADSVVGWNSERIISAIEGKDSWECSDGSEMGDREIKRIKCQ